MQAGKHYEKYNAWPEKMLPKACTGLQIPKVTTVSDLSDVQEVWLCLPEQRNVNHSLKQRVNLCVCMDFFVASQLSILRQGLVSKQSFLLFQTVSNPYSPEEIFCLLFTKEHTSCNTG